MKKKLIVTFLCLGIFINFFHLSKMQIFAHTDQETKHSLSNINEINSYNDLVEACALGGTYMLKDSIILRNSITIPSNVNLTLLQEPEKNHRISATGDLDTLFYVKPNGTLTLGSSFSDSVILDGKNLNAYGSVISSSGNLYIKNADISSPNGSGILCDTIFFENGQIHNCKYKGISVSSYGTFLEGSFSNCMYGIFVHPESTVIVQNGEYTTNQTAIYSKGNCTIYGGFFSKCEYTLQSSLGGSIDFSGGIISDAVCWALDVSNGGSIYFTGGEIKNSRSTTYPAPDQNLQGTLHIGGSPYMDNDSFIYCRTGSPIVQISSLSAPASHPDSKLQIAAYSLDTPVVIAASTNIQMEKEKNWYISYDSSYDFVVTDNKLYANGYVPPYDGQLPTVRPDNSPETIDNTPRYTASPATICPTNGNTMSPETILPSPTTTPDPVTPEPSPSCNPTQDTEALPELDYSNFVQTAPVITKITCKGFSFHLNWNFDCILSPDHYNIYYSTDRKHYTLEKTVKGFKTTASLSIPKAFKGKRIYFRIVALISDEATMYQSKKSNIVSRYLLSKVTGTSISYYTDKEKLKITWNKSANCTGYYIYLRASSGGTTALKKCASVSSSQHSASFSSSKIKRLFSKNGKPVRVKGCYVRAYYKAGNKIAYSP